ncbi:MAG TPA: outer membrane lipoprotein carrier protein LolA [Candidatus Hydrogenedens sp.]|nr:outer membrane lipoprotein carrier protein LolA [Candidatus Hydrogenedens sp.]
MNKSFILTLITILFAFIPNSIYCQNLDEDKELNDFFKKYTEAREKIDILVAKFIQKSIYPDETYITSGKLIFVKPRRLVFYTEDPQKYTVIENKKIYEYEPDIKQITIYDLDDQIDTELFFLAFAQDLNELRKKYHVVPIQLSDERGKNGVSIKPFKENEEDAQFEEIVLYLRDDNFLPYRLRIVNKDDAQTIVDFEKMEINGKISLEDTQIYLPSGTNVIENDVQKEIVSGDGKRIPEPAKLDPKYISTAPPKDTGKSTEKNGDTRLSDRPEVEIEEKDLEPIQK